MDKVEVKNSEKIKERGVFATTDIKKDETIEVCPLLLLPMAQMKYIEKTSLKFYYFEITNKNIAIVWGYGSLYNHSYDSNARYDMSARKKTMEIIAFKDIKKGDEIFVNYNWGPTNKNPLTKWYDPDFKDLSK